MPLFGRKKFLQLLQKKVTLAVIVGIGVVGIIAVRSGGADDVAPREERLPVVSLLDISSYTQDTAVVQGTGQVEAAAQVELRSEVSARITSIPVTIGQDVFAGQILARFDSTELVAQLRQVEADLSSAQAGVSAARSAVTAQESTLDDLRAGGRPEEVAIRQSQLNSALAAEAKSYDDATNLFETIIPSVENEIFTDIDPLFINPETGNPSLSFGTIQITNKQLVVAQRAELNTLLPQWRSAALAVVPSDRDGVVGVLESSEEKLLFLQDFLTTLTATIKQQTTLSDTTENQYIATVAGVRSVIAGHLSSVRAQQNAIEDAARTVEQARDQLALTQQGATAQQVATQIAAVEQSRANLEAQEAAVERIRGSLDGIRAQLAKRVITSPISGTVGQLPIRVGELISPSGLVASVVNTTGLQIKAFVDSSVASFVAVGATSTIDATIAGAVTAVSPSIDPQTRKVEVTIAVTAEDPALLVGEFVDVEIEKNIASTAAVRLPLRSISITTAGASVYTVEDATVVGHEVTLGSVVGETVEVLSGLEGLTVIVDQVRGISSGDRVTIRQ